MPGRRHHSGPFDPHAPLQDGRDAASSGRPVAPSPDWSGRVEETGVDNLDPTGPDGPADPDDSVDAFEALVAAALDALPPAFRERLDTVAVTVEDEPTPEELARVHAPGLLGLYTGVPRTAYGASDVALPSRITIYRRPHLQLFRDPESLARGVAATVRHEVAHHFGISDARLEELARGHS